MEILNEKQIMEKRREIERELLDLLAGNGVRSLFV